MQVKSEGPVVIVGANGSGKTRLGSWIELESGQQDKVHRISAQKSLVMPEFAAPTSIDRAESELLWGYFNPAAYGYSKLSPRWGQKPNTFLLNDYEKLVNFLFTDEAESNAVYKRKVRELPDQRLEPPETKLDTIKRIWEEILPHRHLLIGGGKVETAVSGRRPCTNIRLVPLDVVVVKSPASNSRVVEGLFVQSRGRHEALYNASEMSDGERVIFYLIGQTLSAPEDGIIVIDEPELHLHRSIQATLWDKIEAERPDALFVYLTHDLDFAASRISATKVWLQSYDGTRWDWHQVEEAEGIPEQLYLEILGGRKPVLFCEGDKGSLDYFLFQKAYPDFTVAPCGTAYGVIQATRSFTAFEHLHNHACHGIVDRDFREDAEVEWLKGISVSVLDHSEIENVLLSEDVLRAVADHQRLADNFPKLIERTRDIIFREVAQDREKLISSITAAKVEQRLKNFNAKACGKVDLHDALTNLTSSISTDALYEETASEVDRVITGHDYSAALRLYNNKGLLGKIEPLFGFARKGMTELIKRLASKKESGAVLAALQKQLPSIDL